ncbi:hypothetical protein [Novosphingobium marinum]|uniref:Uncharacterized protein n=1 Tax=Novosphingobium marinum TaxID=1514948 RepID=A0A7Z0BRL3_9SPHN|nr:hypothetical protein [Novosphingobium marinum]NYH93951.1 hypothetical protein [Novosphingobium marinum]
MGHIIAEETSNGISPAEIRFELDAPSLIVISVFAKTRLYWQSAWLKCTLNDGSSEISKSECHPTAPWIGFHSVQTSYCFTGNSNYEYFFSGAVSQLGSAGGHSDFVRITAETFTIEDLEIFASGNPEASIVLNLQNQTLLNLAYTATAHFHRTDGSFRIISEITHHDPHNFGTKSKSPASGMTQFTCHAGQRILAKTKFDGNTHVASAGVEMAIGTKNFNTLIADEN